jgi:hypothetical protein
MRKQRSSLEETTKPAVHLDELLTYTDLARLTGESVMTHRRRKMMGVGPRFLRIGRHIRFRRQDVAAWLDSCAQCRAKNAEAV